MRTKFIRSILALCVSTTITAAANAQTVARMDVPGTWSLGTTIGMSDLWGDVGTKSVIDHYNNGKYFSKMHGMGGLFTRVALHPAFALRLSIDYGTLYATDEWNYRKAVKEPSFDADAVQRYARHQDAKTNIWEGSLLMEFNPLRMNPENKAAHRAGQPYVLAGLGYFHFQPYTSLGSHWVKTYPLDLEGNGFPVAGLLGKYSLMQMCIPLGIGYKFDISRHLNLGIEYMYRICFTDYLDGVSGKYIDPKYYNMYLSPSNAALASAVADKSQQAFDKNIYPPGYNRGNPSNNDSYSTISIILYYRVKSRRRPWWEE